MTDISPESAAPQEVGTTAPGPPIASNSPSRFSLIMRKPLVRVASTVIAFVLGWGAVQAGHDLWASRHDSTPISSSSHARSGALRVTGHGVSLTFPRGWVNVPTTPAQLARFMRANARKFPHLRAAVRSELENVQNMRNSAMLVYRVNPSGTVTGSLYASVVPAAIPPSQLKRRYLPTILAQMTQIGATIRHDSVTTFGTYPALLVIYTLPGTTKGTAEHCALAYVEGPTSTPSITVKTLSAANSIATLRRIVDTIRFG